MNQFIGFILYLLFISAKVILILFIVFVIALIFDWLDKRSHKKEVKDDTR